MSKGSRKFLGHGKSKRSSPLEGSRLVKRVGRLGRSHMSSNIWIKSSVELGDVCLMD